MSKNHLKSFFDKFLILFLCVFSFGMTIFHPISIKQPPSQLCSINYQIASANSSFKDFFDNIFNRKKKGKIEKQEKKYVYLGGYPLGFTISCSGVIVVAKSNDNAVDIKEGDIITQIDGINVSSAEQILLILNSEDFAGRKVDLTVKRNNKFFHIRIKPIYDENQKVYKLGFWIRDNAAGVGTITYIKKDDLRFGALGHPVCDIDTGTCLPVFKGNIYKCNVVGVKRGNRGNAGELRGLFLRNGSILGKLDKNNKFGVFGNFNKKYLSRFNDSLIEVGHREDVKSGKAKIRCTIDGTVPKDYDIEIVKTYIQSSKENKSMFIRVTDKRLIEKTGGIVQGMSGSPIIQNGKLVGAVTHVFVSDPTKGYGIYLDWMMEN